MSNVITTISNWERNEKGATESLCSFGITSHYKGQPLNQVVFANRPVKDKSRG